VQGWNTYFLPLVLDNTTGILHRIFMNKSPLENLGVFFALYSIAFNGFLLSGVHLKLKTRRKTDGCSE
jgi:hypothetical protein